MVIFKIKDDKSKTKYYYPEGPHEVPFNQFVDYLALVDNHEPEPLSTLKNIEQDARPFVQEAADIIGNELASLAHATGVVRGICQGRIKSTAKARRLLPELLPKLENLDFKREQAQSKILDPVYYTHIILPYHARVVAFFTGMPVERITGQDGQGGMDVNQLQALYRMLVQAVETAPEENPSFDKFTHQGVTYRLPAQFMQKASVIEFAEAAQLQAQATKIKHGTWEALLDICAILCRPTGVPYDEAGYLARKELFKDLPLATVWQVGFFLLRQSAELGKDFLIYTAAHTLSRLKQALPV